MPSPLNHKYTSGLDFELKAQKYLTYYFFHHKIKATLIEERFRYKGGEIDLIYRTQKEPSQLGLYFIEVRGKTANARTFDPILSLTQKKLYRIQNGIHVYLSKNKIKKHEIRFGFLIFNGQNWNFISDIIFL